MKEYKTFRRIERCAKIYVTYESSGNEEKDIQNFLLKAEAAVNAAGFPDNVNCEGLVGIYLHIDGVERGKDTEIDLPDEPVPKTLQDKKKLEKENEGLEKENNRIYRNLNETIRQKKLRERRIERQKNLIQKLRDRIKALKQERRDFKERIEKLRAEYDTFTQIKTDRNLYFKEKINKELELKKAYEKISLQRRVIKQQMEEKEKLTEAHDFWHRKFKEVFENLMICKREEDK